MVPLSRWEEHVAKTILELGMEAGMTVDDVLEQTRKLHQKCKELGLDLNSMTAAEIYQTLKLIKD